MSTGLRISEALALRLSDVDQRACMVRVGEGKGSKDRIAVIDARVLLTCAPGFEVRRRLGTRALTDLLLSGRWLGPEECPQGSVAASKLLTSGPYSPKSRCVPASTNAPTLTACVTRMRRVCGGRRPPARYRRGNSAVRAQPQLTPTSPSCPSERIKAMREAGWTLDGASAMQD